MKNLANCDPVEFLMQTNRIRKAAESWLELTKLKEIRVEAAPLPVDATEEQRRQARRDKTRRELTAIFDAVTGEHPRETAELLGLMCFIEPEDIRNHSMKELLGAFMELISCPEVLDFFTWLKPWARAVISATQGGFGQKP